MNYYGSDYGWNSALGGFALRDTDVRLVTDLAAESEPLSIADEVVHSRLDSPADSGELDYITSLFPAARKIVESIIHRPIGVQEFEYMMVSFPCGSIMEFPRTDVTEVKTIKYMKLDGSVTTYYDSTASPVVDPGTFILETGCTPPAIFLKSGESWPLDILQTGFPVKIRFMAGLDVDSLPADLMQMLRLVFGYLYENREIAIETPTRSIIADIPDIQNWLKNNYGRNLF